MIEVTINQQTVTVKQQSFLQKVLLDYGISQSKGIAVAINSVVIPRQHWGDTLLQANDQVIIIKAAQGGWYGIH